MPATDGASTRGVPAPLLIVAAAFFVARVVMALTQPAAPAQPEDSPVKLSVRRDAIRWREPGVGEIEAQSVARPVLYDFTADWCPPCKAMKREVFADTGFARRLEAVAVPIQVLDRQREDGRNEPAVAALQQQFHVNAFPTLVVYEPRTGKFERLEGYPGAAETRSWMLEKPQELAASPAPDALPDPGKR